ncbi:hypothetical protein C8Q76DRAFT_695800 [Earliella scabrosa]|nr:hypothetical protein C8Q76DRAFT_695800 [Earliella scabrosa]
MAHGKRILNSVQFLNVTLEYLRPRSLNVPTRMIHKTSIMDAVDASGLQRANHTESTPASKRTQTSASTLVLSNINVEEHSEVNPARLQIIGPRLHHLDIDHPESFGINKERWTEVASTYYGCAAHQGFALIPNRHTGALAPDSTLPIALSSVGGEPDERVVANTLAEPLAQPTQTFSEPLHSLVIVARRLHYLDVEYAQNSTVDKER